MPLRKLEIRLAFYAVGFRSGEEKLSMSDAFFADLTLLLRVQRGKAFVDTVAEEGVPV